jgi:hypothetical protein
MSAALNEVDGTMKPFPAKEGCRFVLVRSHRVEIADPSDSAQAAELLLTFDSVFQTVIHGCRLSGTIGSVRCHNHDPSQIWAT